MKTIFRGGWQLIKVRGVMLFSLFCAVGCVWAGIDLAETYGLNPGDGGVLAPLATRLGVGIGVALLGITFFAVMWIYGKCYIGRIEFDERSKVLHIYTVRFLGSKKLEIKAGRISDSRYHEGKLNLDSSVNAPWHTVWIKERRLPLILDEQGEFLDEKVINRLFKI